MNADGTETAGEAFQAIISPVSAILDPRLIWAIASQVIIAGILGFIIHLLTGWTWFAYIIGATVWTIILCFTQAMNLWFIKPLGNHAVVLEHALHRKERVAPENVTRLQPTRAYRVVWGPALTGKSVFETPLNNQAINIQRAVALDGTVKVSTKDGANHAIRFWTSCRVIETDQGLVNLARHTESVVVDYFKKSFVAYFQQTIGQITDTDQLIEALSMDTNGNHGRVVKGFNELFWGKDRIHPDESERGMQTGDPKCEIDIDERFRRSRQALPAARRKREAINALTETVNGRPGVHPDIAANMVAVDSGDTAPATVSKQVIEVPAGSGSRDLHIVLDNRGRS